MDSQTVFNTVIVVIQTGLMYLQWRSSVTPAGGTLSAQRAANLQRYWPLAAMAVLVLLSWAPVFYGGFQETTTLRNVESSMKEWAEEYRYGTQPLNNANALFAYEFTRPHEGKVIVTRRKDMERYLEVATRQISFGEGYRKVFQALPVRDREVFEAELAMELLKTGLQFTLEIPNYFVVFKHVPIGPSLTENAFIDALHDIDTGGKLVAAFTRSRLQLQP